MTKVLTNDHYKKFSAFEKDYLSIEKDLNRLEKNIEKNKNIIRGLDNDITPIMEKLTKDGELRLPLNSQKGYKAFSKKIADELGQDLEKISKEIDYSSMGLMAKIIKKIKNSFRAVFHLILNFDTIYYNSLYNKRLLDHYKDWVQYSITEIQDNLFLQKDINQRIITILSKTMLLVQKFNEISIDHVLASNVRQKELKNKIDLIREKDSFLMSNLKKEETFREYFQKIESYKESINHLIIKISDILKGINSSGNRNDSGASELEQAIDDQLYFHFENIFRGEKHEIKLQFQQYIDMVIDREPVIDIGCGRGEFLELLKENNIQGYGIDKNTSMINACKKSGISIIDSDALSFLKQTEDESIGSIFSSHVLEHLSIFQIEEFLRQSFRVLKKDGLLIIETLDPSSFIGYHYYYLMDPTHKTPIHPYYIRFLSDSIGFADSFIYRPSKDYDKILNKKIINDLADDSVSDKTIEAFRTISDKLGNNPEYALISKKG